LHRPVRYIWLPQSEKSFKALAAGQCDAMMEVPSRVEQVRTTRPYYRSAYVFVTRRDRRLGIRSFDDPRLKSLRIGVQVFGADAPAAHALSARGIVHNVRWYTLYQNYLSASQPRRLIDAVANGDVDVAIAWGPQAGYFAASASAPLRLTPVSPEAGGSVPFAFDIAMGVGRQNARLASDLNRVLSAHAAEIRQILTRYGVPLAPRRYERTSTR
jgi:mxaJ protein